MDMMTQTSAHRAAASADYHAHRVAEGAIPSGQPPASRAFNVVVQTMARMLYPTGYDVSPHVPSATAADRPADYFARIMPQRVRWQSPRMVISSAHCNNNIFGDHEVNMDFRAWHDWCHYRHNIGFSASEEARAARKMREHVLMHFGNRGEDTTLFCEVIDVEITDAAHLFQTTGQFPENPRRFLFEKLPVRRLRRLDQAFLDEQGAGYITEA